MPNFNLAACLCLALMALSWVSLASASGEICRGGQCTDVPPLGEFQGAVVEMCSCKSAQYNEIVNFIGNSYYYYINNLDIKWSKGGEDPSLILKRAGKKDKRVDIRQWSHEDLKTFLFSALGTSHQSL